MRSVNRGAALLDERLPGWRHEVDPATLRLDSGCNCVLGQIFGAYDRGVDLLGVKPEDFGFYVGPRSTWERLTDAWRKKLAR